MKRVWSYTEHDAILVVVQSKLRREHEIYKDQIRKKKKVLIKIVN